MKPSDRVITQYGRGTVVNQEGKEGVLADRWLVKVDDLAKHPTLQEIQGKQGGIYFHVTELKQQNKQL